MKQSLVILGLLFIGTVLPMVFLQRWLKQRLQPQRSLGRLGLMILIMLAVVMLLTYLLVLLVTQVFPRA